MGVNRLAHAGFVILFITRFPDRLVPIEAWCFKFLGSTVAASYYTNNEDGWELQYTNPASVIDIADPSSDLEKFIRDAIIRAQKDDFQIV